MHLYYDKTRKRYMVDSPAGAFAIGKGDANAILQRVMEKTGLRLEIPEDIEADDAAGDSAETAEPDSDTKPEGPATKPATKPPAKATKPATKKPARRRAPRKRGK